MATTESGELRAELSSTASLLDDLRTRVEGASLAYAEAKAEDIAAELGEVERQLRTAQRRLDRLLGSL